MKPKTIILLVVAIGCGLVASFMTSRLLADKGTPEEPEKVKVLVVAKNLPYGLLLKEPQELFVEKAYTKGDEPRKAIQTYEALKGRRLNKALTAEQFVFPDDLMDPKNPDQFATLPKGSRAVAISVNAQKAVGGFVQPGNRVDVVYTVRKGDNESYSQTILQNMLVMAVDTNPTRDEQGARVGNTVTLAARPDEAKTESGLKRRRAAACPQAAGRRKFVR